MYVINHLFILHPFLNCVCCWKFCGGQGSIVERIRRSQHCHCRGNSCSGCTQGVTKHKWCGRFGPTTKVFVKKEVFFFETTQWTYLCAYMCVRTCVRKSVCVNMGECIPVLDTCYTGTWRYCTRQIRYRLPTTGNHTLHKRDHHLFHLSRVDENTCPAISVGYRVLYCNNTSVSKIISHTGQ